MEPRADDGDDGAQWAWNAALNAPQWSPVLMTGTTTLRDPAERIAAMPQWSPVLMTGTTFIWSRRRSEQDMPQWSPVLMTGTTQGSLDLSDAANAPQWSPVLMTGTTGTVCRATVRGVPAAMEPRADDGDDTGVTHAPSCVP